MDWNHMLVAQERREDQLRQAEQWRQWRKTLVRRERHETAQGRIFVWLGRRLVSWGVRLQKRYSAATHPVPARSMAHFVMSSNGTYSPSAARERFTR